MASFENFGKKDSSRREPGRFSMKDLLAATQRDRSLDLTDPRVVAEEADRAIRGGEEVGQQADKAIEDGRREVEELLVEAGLDGDEEPKDARDIGEKFDRGVKGDFNRIDEQFGKLGDDLKNIDDAFRGGRRRSDRSQR